MGGFQLWYITHNQYYVNIAGTPSCHKTLYTGTLRYIPTSPATATSHNAILHPPTEIAITTAKSNAVDHNRSKEQRREHWIG